MCLCKSQLLSVNLGDCGVYARRCEPGAAVVHRSVSRVTATRGVRAAQAAKTTAVTEITFAINVRGTLRRGIFS